MDIFILATLTLGLAVYALRLQRKIKTYEVLIAGTAEMLIDIADNKLEIVRTADGVHIRKVGE